MVFWVPPSDVVWHLIHQMHLFNIVWPNTGDTRNNSPQSIYFKIEQFEQLVNYLSIVCKRLPSAGKACSNQSHLGQDGKDVS